MDEVDRQQRQLIAKTEAERCLSATITDLSNQRQQLNDTISNSNKELEEAKATTQRLQDSLQSAYSDICDAKKQETERAVEESAAKLSSEVMLRQELQYNLQNLQEQHDHDKVTLLMQVGFGFFLLYIQTR